MSPVRVQREDVRPGIVAAYVELATRHARIAADRLLVLADMQVPEMLPGVYLSGPATLRCGGNAADDWPVWAVFLRAVALAGRQFHDVARQSRLNPGFIGGQIASRAIVAR